MHLENCTYRKKWNLSKIDDTPISDIRGMPRERHVKTGRDSRQKKSKKKASKKMQAKVNTTRPSFVTLNKGEGQAEKSAGRMPWH